MRRWIFFGLLVGLLAISVSAQSPAPTSEPPLVVAMPAPQAPQQAGGILGEAEPILVDVFSDMELLLITVTQSTQKPEGWYDTLDVTNAQLPLLLRLNLELLAGTTLGETVRPFGWKGPVPGDPSSISADIRYDLELIADDLVGIGNRPSGWIGYRGDPLLLCTRTARTFLALLQRNENFVLTVDPLSPTYCADLELQLRTFTEQVILSQPPEIMIFTTPEPTPPPNTIYVQTNFAVSFFDTDASIRAGVIPAGSPVVPIARSGSRFSRMTLVQGVDFAVFIDYQNTDLTEDNFEALPAALNVNVIPFCDADWCE